MNLDIKGTVTVPFPLSSRQTVEPLNHTPVSISRAQNVFN